MPSIRSPTARGATLPLEEGRLRRSWGPPDRASPPSAGSRRASGTRARGACCSAAPTSGGSTRTRCSPAWRSCSRTCPSSRAPSRTTSAWSGPTPPTRRCARPPGARRRSTSSRRCPGASTPPRGEGGSTLSGGERQRVSIARALLKDAPVVLLDALNEVTVQSAITELVRGRTVAVIAHRLRSIRDADRIFVIDGAGRRPGDPRRAHGPLRPLPAPVGGAGAGRGLADSEAPSIAAWAGTLALNAGGAAQPINPHGRPLPPANHTAAACPLHPAKHGAEQPARRLKQDPHSLPLRVPRRRAPRRPSFRASPPWRRTAPPGARTGSPARGARRP